MPAPYNHSSGLAGAYDRSPDFPDWTRIVFREGKMGQATELNELQSILEGRGRRTGNLVASDGDRVDGASILLDVGAGTARLDAGKVYVRGDVRDVAAAVLTGVPMSGEVQIGVRIVKTVITEVQEPVLTGLLPGSEAEGEAGAGREVETIAWGRIGDGVAGDLYPVYLLINGTVIDQTPPPALSGINQAIASYDRDAHGGYVVNGCRVSVIGKIAGAWHFGISEGVANINGFKRTRATAIRHIEPEAFTTVLATSEPHTFGASSPSVITINHGPIAAVPAAIVTKEKTVTLTKGTTNSLDSLPDGSVTSIISVIQGGTTFVASTSYNLTSDHVDWSPGGAEPASGSTYSVTYRYLAAVTPDATSDTTVTLSGGVAGTSVFLTYTHKLPRVDLLCLNQDGASVYLKGIATADRPIAPDAPSELLGLAEISNDWMSNPIVTNVDVRAVPYVELWHYLRRLFDALDLIALERLKRDIDAREPVAKKGIFVDPFNDDTYRDAGVAQTAAIFGGTMQLAIDPSFFRPTMTSPISLNFTEEVVVRQELATACMKINPYQNFLPLPGTMALTPSSDFWVQRRTDWLSPTTQEFAGTENSTVTSTVLEAERSQILDMLRQISVAFTIQGFGAGEALSRLSFDGVDVTPAGIVANGSGVATGSFTIPANVPAGVKAVRAAGAGGTLASAQFVGQGTIDISVMRTVTTIFNAPPPPSPPSDTAQPWTGPTQGNENDTAGDPLAQTFTLTEARHIIGTDIKFCAVGNRAKHCLVQLREVQNGLPTRKIVAEAYVDMNTITLNAWTAVRFSAPVYLPSDREFCFVILTDDANHSVSIASVGDFDAAQQAFAGAQPYSVGVLLSSSNNSTWTAHQNSDLTFRLVAASFSPTSKTVNLGSFTVTNASDFIVRAVSEIPTAAASLIFELQRADSSVIQLLPGQNLAMTSYVNETVQLRAILNGSAKISPTLYPGVLLIAGSIRSSGTYVSRAFDMGTAIRMSNYFKALLPSGSSVTVEIDKVDNSFSSVALFATSVLDNGQVELEYRVTPYTTPLGRLRITLNGTPAARPNLSDFRAVAI